MQSGGDTTHEVLRANRPSRLEGRPSNGSACWHPARASENSTQKEAICRHFCSHGSTILPPLFVSIAHNSNANPEPCDFLRLCNNSSWFSPVLLDILSSIIGTQLGPNGSNVLRVILSLSSNTHNLSKMDTQYTREHGRKYSCQNGIQSFSRAWTVTAAPAGS